MRRLLLLMLLAAAIAAATPAAVTGRWIVTVSGPVQTTCLATIDEANGALSGEVSCREAGVQMKIGGGAQGDLSSGTAPGGVSWTGARDGAGLVGTWQSPQGSGTWTARRAPRGS